MFSLADLGGGMSVGCIASLVIWYCG